MRAFSKQMYNIWKELHNYEKIILVTKDLIDADFNASWTQLDYRDIGCKCNCYWNLLFDEFGWETCLPIIAKALLQYVLYNLVMYLLTLICKEEEKGLWSRIP